MAEQNNSFPSISEKNWWTLRDKFKASIPVNVSTNYIKTLLSMANDNSANSNVISPLKRMGLVDDENKPTALANEWRLDDSYKSACSKIIEKIYPRELLDLFPTTDVDRAIARNWFMSQGVGQGAADKMVALFILLKSGEIKQKKSSTSSKESIKSPAKTKAKVGGDINTSISNKTSENFESGFSREVSNNRPNLHIDLQIHISPDSSPEQIETIFASMAKHLYGNDAK